MTSILHEWVTDIELTKSIHLWPARIKGHGHGGIDLLTTCSSSGGESSSEGVAAHNFQCCHLFIALTPHNINKVQESQLLSINHVRYYLQSRPRR